MRDASEPSGFRARRERGAAMLDWSLAAFALPWVYLLFHMWLHDRAISELGRTVVFGFEALALAYCWTRAWMALFRGWGHRSSRLTRWLAFGLLLLTVWPLTLILQFEHQSGAW